MPEGDAAALRVLSIGKSLRQIGLDVEFLSWSTPAEENLDYRIIDGFPYRSIGEFRSVKLSPLRRLVGFITRGHRTVDILSETDISGVNSIICYNPGSYFLKSMMRFCEAHKIQLLIDSTEWYDPAHLPGGRFGAAGIDELLRMRFVMPEVRKGIVISQFLKDHFEKQGMLTAVVPPTVDLEDPKWTEGSSEQRLNPPSETEPLRLIYAGNPGKKDKLGEILQAIRIVNQEQERVVIHVAGPSREDLGKSLGSEAKLIDDLGGSLIFTGRVPAREVPKLIRTCHFSIIARPKARYAIAGFPTKLVESLTAGRPVITTSWGDESRYVRDGISGLVANSCSAVDLASTLARAASLTSHDWIAMAEAAREAARNSFDYRAYGATLANLINFKCEG